ncbi:MAG: hypothetical protein KBH78_08205 [Candidatus Hydrogenedentes bacterium]|nr:hypothetical protein [Candidatus Hydrogenedentota bacterium]
MMKRKAGLFMLAGILVVATGCATVSSLSPFRFTPNAADLPRESVDQLAREMESKVAAGDRAMELTPREGLVIREGVLQAARTRAIRSDLVKNLLRSGYAVEQRNGTIALIRDKEYRKATTSRERDRNALIIMSENADRWTIYEGLIRDSKLKGSALSGIQDAFYQARISLLEPGMKYQDEEGKTVSR